MADFDSKLPIRSLAVDNTTEIADSAGTTINPAKEDGNLASIKTDTDTMAAWNSGGRALVTIQADATVNVDKVAGTATSVNTGNSDAGTQRVVLASDQPAVAENLTKVGGAAIALGQTTMSASVPVVIASDQSAVPVSFSNATVELPQYNTAASIAAAASSTQTYSPGSTVHLDGVDASASGQLKIEIQYGTTGSEATKAVFFTSKGNLQLSWRLPNPITITNTMSVKVIRTNMDNQAMDVYSTIQVH